MTQQPSSASEAMPRSLDRAGDFVRRRIGITATDEVKMLAAVGNATLDGLVDAAVRGGILTPAALKLPPAASEAELIAELRGLATLDTPGGPTVEVVGASFDQRSRWNRHSASLGLT
jgi:glycine dehydrogenase